ncbi:hypothetical protein [Actimicrobium antarcticum]|uniref:Uncharacterized protein n=1 Tax=Actimicrobium antarcticum TaxID=1051899 RepID=A0ABP7SMV0_9BURK
MQFRNRLIENVAAGAPRLHAAIRLRGQSNFRDTPAKKNSDPGNWLLQRAMSPKTARPAFAGGKQYLLYLLIAANNISGFS